MADSGGDALAARPLEEPHPSRLAPDHPLRTEILRRHADALEHDRDYYRDPATGYLVMTAAYLAARGRCCQTGCRHCPYVA